MSNKSESNNIINSDLPIRYFYINLKACWGGKVNYTNGVEKKNEFTGRVEWVGSKSFYIERNGIMKTNNPAIIDWVETKRLDNRKFEEVFLKETRETYDLMKEYNIDVKKHSDSVKKAIDSGGYKYVQEKSLEDEIALELNKRKSYELEILRAENKKLAELSKKNKIEDMSKILKKSKLEKEK